jgi:16S rRNA (guanine966-N2)-methyltransferase
MFSSLESSGAIEGARVVDLFAGTGALGIEALSRGAAHAVFVDADPVALTTVRSNLAVTALADQGEIVRSDVVRFLEGTGEFDLAFVDPPYEFDAWPEVLALLSAGTAVLESNRELEPGDQWRTVKHKRYGDTVVTVIVRSPVTD